ncbi:hypothetical protein [Nostoc sp.]|uniref:hypothetical protein n=1 Tax=Nostoc sp. TaxID=1180 RepID=UPI002FF7C498
MLKTTSKTVQDSFFISFDENLLSELSSDEASEITGGFTVTNRSGSPIDFYILEQTVSTSTILSPILAQSRLSPTEVFLQPGQSGTYDYAEYILYNSSRTQLKPALSGKLGSTNRVAFSLEGDTVLLSNDFASRILDPRILAL